LFLLLVVFYFASFSFGVESNQPLQLPVTVLDDLNSVVSLDFNFTLNAYNASTSGILLFTVDSNNTPITTQGKGVLNFSTDYNFNFDNNVWIELIAGSSDGSIVRQTLSPRIRWGKVPFAERARTVGDPDANIAGKLVVGKSIIVQNLDRNALNITNFGGQSVRLTVDNLDGIIYATNLIPTKNDRYIGTGLRPWNLLNAKDGNFSNDLNVLGKVCLNSSCSVFARKNSSDNFNLQFGSGTDFNLYDSAGLASTIFQTNWGGTTNIGQSGVDPGIGGGAGSGFFGAVDSGGNTPGFYCDSSGACQQYMTTTTGSVTQHYDSRLILESQYSGISGAGVMVRPTGSQNPFGITNSSSTPLVQWNALGGYRILTNDQNDFIDEGTSEGFVFAINNPLLTTKDRFSVKDFTSATNPEAFGVTSAAVPSIYAGRPGSMSSGYIRSNAVAIECGYKGGGTCGATWTVAGTDMRFVGGNTKGLAFKAGTNAGLSDGGYGTTGMFFDLDDTLADSNNSWLFARASSFPSHATAFKSPVFWVQLKNTPPSDQNIFMYSVKNGTTQFDRNGWYVDRDFNMTLAGKMDVNLGYKSNGLTGLTQQLTVADKTLLGTCTIDVNGGIITASTCT